MIKIPENVLQLLNTIHKAGYEAYIVGGCVRDMYLNTEPKDWDITTSATPEQIKMLFSKTIDTGIEHGTVTVMKQGEAYEITTYRIEGKYEDHRRPSEVAFTKNLTEDLLRRDFTINAMAYNEEEGLIDLYHGLEDLEKGIIRCVGVADERFQEDALRILRGFRFAARFGFEIEEETYEAMSKHGHLLEHISAERIQVELTKTLITDYPRQIEDLVKTDVFRYIIPEFESIINLEQDNPYHHLTVDQHTYLVLEEVPKIPTLRWAAYLHDLGKGYTKTVDDKGIGHFYGHGEKSAELAYKILKRLKFDNKTIKDVVHLVKYHGYNVETTEKSVRRSVRKIGEAYYDDWLALRRGDMLAKHRDKQVEIISKLNRIHELYELELARNSCFQIKDLALNGSDLIELGIKPGKTIGERLNRLLDLVVDFPEMNQKEKLIKWLEDEELL